MNIAISGMHCQACVRRVRKALDSVEGVQIERVEIGRAIIYVDMNGLQAVLDAIRTAGYQPWPQQ
jgi:copper chaperone CopZ